MKCEKAVTEYLKNDDRHSIPVLVRIHMVFCTKCSSEIYRLMSAMDRLENESFWRTDRNITGYVMDRINTENVYSEKRVSGLKWVLNGIILISGILLINYSDSFLWLKEQYGSGFVIPMSIVLGLGLTIYMMLLTLGNYDYLEKYLNYIHKGRWKY